MAVNDLLIHFQGGERRFELVRNIRDHPLQKFLCLFLLFRMSGENSGQLVHLMEQAVPASSLLTLNTGRGIPVKKFSDCAAGALDRLALPA